MNLLQYLDYAGVAVFASTGALVASRKKLDIIGFLFLASFTGVGGGTARDVILDLPVFWVINPAYVLVCAVIAVLVFFTAHLFETRYKLLLWLDALGMSAYVIIGTAKGLAATDSPIVAIVTGLLTATFGGILCDLMAGKPSVLLRSEIYVSAAMVGAVFYTLADIAEFPTEVSTAVAFVATFIVRGSALKFGWTFPAYRGRRARRPEDVP